MSGHKVNFKVYTAYTWESGSVKNGMRTVMAAQSRKDYVKTKQSNDKMLHTKKRSKTKPDTTKNAQKEAVKLPEKVSGQRVGT